ncbi:MAG: TylF/MycF/NovP-related O-methyltransferase [Planctomycetota bacterium]
MSASADTNPYAKNAALKGAVRKTLGVMQAVLPKSAYAAMYRPSFAVYQQALRSRYAMRLAAAKRAGDAAAIDRLETVHRVMPHSLIGSSGLEHTYDRAMGSVRGHVPGAFVECGVARGGCAALLTHVATQSEPARECWYFDSFEGLPDPTEKDLEDGRTGHHIRPLPKGSCLGTIEQVSELLFDEFGYDREDVHLVQGWFQDTLPVTREAIGPVALLRVDGDWFDSTYCVLTQLFDQVSDGGAVIIDDYWSCHGARKATDQFLAERGVETELVPDGRGGMSFIKPSGVAAVAA